MVSKEHTELGQRLRSLRRQRSLTSQEVADAVGTTQSHLCSIERGRTASPRYKLLRSLAEFYQLSISELVGDAREPSTNYEAQQVSYWFEHELPESAQRIAYTMIDQLRREYRDVDQ